MKFKVGDKVRVTQGWDTVNGTEGVIAAVCEAANYTYNVTLNELPRAIQDMNTTVYNWMMEEDELEPVEG